MLVYPAQVHLKNGDSFFEDEDVQVEHTLDVYVDGELSMRIVCTPQHMVELVIGRLFTEGFIKSADDIELVYLCEFGTKARTLLKEKRGEAVPVSAPIVPTCCTGNKVFATVEAFESDLRPVVPIPWKLGCDSTATTIPIP